MRVILPHGRVVIKASYVLLSPEASGSLSQAQVCGSRMDEERCVQAEKGSCLPLHLQLCCAGPAFRKES